MKSLKITAFFSMLFFTVLCSAQVKYRETSFVGGVSGDGVCDPATSSYTFIPNIPAGSTVTKAIIFGGRHGDIYHNFVLTNVLNFTLAGVAYQFNPSNQVSPTFQSPAYNGNSGVHAVDVTTTVANLSPGGYFFKKIQPYSSSTQEGRYTDFYLYVEFQHPSLTSTTYSAIFIENEDFNVDITYNMSLQNPIKNTSDVGIAFFGGYTCNTTDDATKVYVNGTDLGNAGSNNVGECEGLMGDFYMHNGVLAGIGDDIPDQKVKDKDALSNIKNLVPNGALSVQATFHHQGTTNAPIKNTKDNAIWGVFLVYSESCVQPTVSLPPSITTCDAQATVDAGNGGTSYSWNNGATTQSITTNTSGEYIVTVTNASGCSKSDTVQITVNALPQVNLGNDTTVCASTFILNAANNGFNYMWSNGATTQSITATSNGTYAVIVTDNNGCSASDNISLAFSTPPTISLGPDVVTCNGSYQINAPATGFTYLWNNGETDQAITVNTTGTYSVVATNTTGCNASSSIHVNIDSVPKPNLGNDVSICASQYTINAGGVGVSYQWSTSQFTQSITVTSSGTYSVLVTNANSCTNSASIDVILNTPPVISLGPDVTTCNGSHQIDAGVTGLTYVWNTGDTDQTITVNATGTYSLIATNGNGCTASSSIHVNLDSVPKPNLGSNISTCASQYTLNAGGVGVSYQWSTSQFTQNINVTSSGTYSVLVTNANGCTNSASVQVALNSNPVVNLGPDADVCDDEYILDAGNPGFTFAWNTGATTQSITTLANGMYAVTITDAAGCTAKDSVTVTLGTIPLADAGPDVIIESGASTQLNATGGISFSWIPATTLSCSTCENPIASPAVTTTYTVIVSNSVGCNMMDTVTVFVSEECDGESFFLPTAFSPNNDGMNDILFLRSKCVIELLFVIYNRWGEKVYESTDPNEGWDGNWRGFPSDPGVFFYHISAQTFNGNTVEQSGNITLVK